MTQADYQAYTDAVAEFIAADKLTFLSTGTRDLLDTESNEDDDTGEPWFSWSPCDCCKSRLGGNREYLYARDENNEIAQYQICEDCVYYIEYGRLDDRTMMEIESEATA